MFSFICLWRARFLCLLLGPPVSKVNNTNSTYFPFLPTHPTLFSFLPRSPILLFTSNITTRFYLRFSNVLSLEMPRRETLAVPIRAKYLWCMHCFRTAYKRHNVEVDAPLSIECIHDAKASILCRQCHARNAKCIPVIFANPLF